MLRYGSILLLASVSSALAMQQAPLIRTVAGGGPDDVPALEAMLANPRAVAAAPGGGFFIGASFHVYHVDAAGRLERFAGNGSYLASGDGGPALQAGLGVVDGLALDASGNVYISSSNLNRVRRIDAATHLITAVAGPGQSSHFGDGGPAVDAYLSYPGGLALDAAGNLYIADGRNCSVRRVNMATGIISTVVGSTFHTCGFSGDGTPALGNGVGGSDVAFDPAGNLLIAAYNRVFRVDRTTGLMYVVAGTGFSGNTGDGGPARDARVEVSRLAVDAAGNLYLTSFAESRVRRVDAATGIISTIAGDGIAGSTGDGGPATQARLNRPVGLAFDAAVGLLIADALNHRVRRVEPGGWLISTVAGRYDVGDGLPALQVPMVPVGIATDAAGNLYIADDLFERVRRVDATTGILTTVAGNGSQDHSGDGGPATMAGLHPYYLSTDATGNLFIGDTLNLRVRRVEAATGTITTAAGDGPCFEYDVSATPECFDRHMAGMAVDAAGNLFVGDGLIQDPEPPPYFLNRRVRRFDAATGIITNIAQAAYGVQNVALDSAGNLFFGDGGFLPEWTDWEHFGPLGNKIWRRDALTGALTPVAGSGLFGFSGDGGPALQASITWPRGILVDGSGNLFFSDADHNRVRRVDVASGVITTVAGDGVARFQGDGGPASAASLSLPYGLAMNRDGDLLVADAGNGRVRVLTNNCPSSPPARCNTAPSAAAGADATVECTSPAGAVVTLDGTASTEADSSTGTRHDIVSFEWYEILGGTNQTLLGAGEVLQVTLPLGEHHVLLRIVDRAGESGEDDLLLNIVDTVAPQLSVFATPSILWPPNHRMVPITLAVTVHDTCDAAPVASLVSVTNSEPDDAPGEGDGRTTDDIQFVASGTGSEALSLRAERQAADNGRLYTLSYMAEDASGNESSAAAGVVVPHDQGGTVEPVEIEMAAHPGAGTSLIWEPVRGAAFYNAIRGSVSSIEAAGSFTVLTETTCLGRNLVDTTLAGGLVETNPSPGTAYFYLVESFDGKYSGYGTESGGREILIRSGDSCH